MKPAYIKNFAALRGLLDRNDALRIELSAEIRWPSGASRHIAEPLHMDSLAKRGIADMIFEAPITKCEIVPPEGSH